MTTEPTKETGKMQVVIGTCPHCKRLITFTYYQDKEYGAFRCEHCGAYGELSATVKGFYLPGSCL